MNINKTKNMSEKGKKANIGEVREWGGEKYRKQVEGWVKVSDGQVKTKMEDSDVDKQDAAHVAKNKKGGAEKNVGLGLFNDTHLFSQRRAEHSKESLTKSVKDILENKSISSPDKVVELFKQGLEIHEIVNVSGTPLSATIDYINKAKKNGQLGEMPKNTSSADEPVEEDLPDVTVNDRWNAYKHFGMMIALNRIRALFAYGSGGVGKTYTLLDEEEGVFSKLKMRKGKINSVLDNIDENGNPIYTQDRNSPDSIIELIPATGERFLKEDEYDYITITGKLTPIRMCELMQEHNGKLLVFDDCDAVFQNGDDGINILKDALDISGDGTILWEGKGALRSQYAGIKGAKPVFNSKGDRTGVFNLPKTFKFTGQVVFISNMKYEDIPQSIRSRPMMIDLTMNRYETIEKVKQIAPMIKFKTPEGVRIIVSDEDRQKAVDFMEKYINKISEADLNMRTFQKIALTYKTLKELGSLENAEDVIAASLFSRNQSKKNG